MIFPLGCHSYEEEQINTVVNIFVPEVTPWIQVATDTAHFCNIINYCLVLQTSEAALQKKFSFFFKLRIDTDTMISFFLWVSPFPHHHKSIVIRLSLQLWLWPLSFLDSKNISQYLRPLQTAAFDENTLKPLMLQNSDHWKEKKKHCWMNPWTIWVSKRMT